MGHDKAVEKSVHRVKVEEAYSTQGTAACRSQLFVFCACAV